MSLFKYTLVLSTILFTVTGNAAESKYPAFTKYVHDYHVALTDIMIEIMSSISSIGQSLNQEPKPNMLRKRSEVMAQKTKLFVDASNGVLKYYRNNVKQLAQSNEIINSIKTNSSPENLSRLETASRSLAEFTTAIIEQEFTVYANEGWANSGISVNRSDIVWVESSGGWRVSPRYDYVDQQGYINDTSNIYNLNKNYPLGALLFRVRGSSKPDGYGLNNMRGRIDSTGRLEFTINDSERRNNDGQLNLRVIIFDGEKLKKLKQSFQSIEGKS